MLRSSLVVLAGAGALVALEARADQPVIVTTAPPAGDQPVVVGTPAPTTGTNPYVVTAPPSGAQGGGGQQIIVVLQGGANGPGSIPPPPVGSLDTEGCKAYLAQLDAQIDDVRKQIRAAADADDDSTAYALKQQLAELQKYRTSERDRLMVSNWGLVAGGAVTLSLGLIALPTALGLALASWRSSNDYGAAAGALALVGLVTVPAGGVMIGLGKADRSARTEVAGVPVQPFVAVGPTGLGAGFAF